MADPERGKAELYLLRLVLTRSDLAGLAGDSARQESERWCSGTITAFTTAGVLNDQESASWRERCGRMLAAAGEETQLPASVDAEVVARAGAELERLRHVASTAQSSDRDARRLQVWRSIYERLGLVPSSGEDPHNSAPAGGPPPKVRFRATDLLGVAVPSAPTHGGPVTVSHVELFENGLTVHGRVDPRSSLGPYVTLGPQAPVMVRDDHGTAYEPLGEITGGALGAFIAWFAGAPAGNSVTIEVTVPSWTSEPARTAYSVTEPHFLPPDLSNGAI